MYKVFGVGDAACYAVLGKFSWIAKVSWFNCIGRISVGYIQLLDNAQIPLDLFCRRPSGLRLVGDQVADKSRTRSATFLFVGCPNSIGSILSETKSPTFFGLCLICDMSETCSKHVGDLFLSRF